jgi:hypothetical protein
MSVGAGFMIPMAAVPTDAATAIGGDVVVPRRRGKSKAPNFKYKGPVSVIRLELDVADERVRQRSGSGRPRFGYAGRCNVMPSIDVGRIGPPTVNVEPIRKGCGSGWGCRAKGSRRQPRRISRPAGGCGIT